MIKLWMSLGPSRVGLIAALVVIGSERAPAVHLPLSSSSSSSSDFTSSENFCLTGDYFASIRFNLERVTYSDPSTSFFKDNK